MNALSNELVWRLGWTLIHSIWQIVGIACFVGVSLSLLSRKFASLRYGIACLGLASLYIASIVTFVILPSPAESEISLAAPQGNAIAVQTPTISAAATSADAVVGSENEVTTAPLTPTVATSLLGSNGGRPGGLQSHWHQWLVVAWGIGVVALGICNMGGWIAVQRLRCRGRLTVPAQIQSQLLALIHRMKIRQSVSIAQSLLVDVPVVIGFFRPVILLPASILSGIPAVQLDAILAHELAHIRRRDYFVNLLQTLTESLFFYHPAVWLISRQIRIEREFCCDDEAIAVCGDRASFVQALAAVERFRGTREKAPRYALSMGGESPGLTLLRARRVMGREQPSSSKGLAGICSILLAIVIGVSMTTIRGDATEPQNSDQKGDEIKNEGVDRSAVKSKIDPSDFRLDVIYSGESDKPFYNYTFSTSRVKLERDLFWQLDQGQAENDPKLQRILSWLDRSGFFQQVDKSDVANPELSRSELSSRYILRVTSRGKVYQEDLSWGPGTLLRLQSLRDALANNDVASPTQLDLLLGRITGYSKRWREGWSESDLKWRLSLEKDVIADRSPINVTLNVENVGQQSQQYGRHAVSASRYEVRVFDRYGRAAPYVGGHSQVREHRDTLAAGKTATIESFDVAQKYYLRRPGKYTVCYVNVNGGQSNAVEFEVTRRPNAPDDGNLVGRLLPLVHNKWDLSTAMGSPGKVHPGSNFEEVVGHQVVFRDMHSSSIRDIALIWFWFTEEKSPPLDGEPAAYPPPSEYHGKFDRWHVYAHIPEKSLQRWPTILDDVKRALGKPVDVRPLEATLNQRPTDFEFLRGVTSATQAEKPVDEQPDNQQPDNQQPDEAIKKIEKIENRQTKKVGAAVVETYHYDGEVHASIHRVTDEALATLAGRTDINVLRLLEDTPFGRGLVSNEPPPSGLTDDGLRHVVGMKNLRLLALPSRGISDKGLVHFKDMTHLEELWLDFLPLTDAGTVHLKGLTQLKVLRFFQAKLTDAGMQNFSEMLNLEDLQLGHSLVTDKSMPLIGKMTKLKTLDLRAKVTNEGLVHLSGLKHLTWLCLSDTAASDPALDHISKLDKLEWLIMSNTSLTDAGLKKIEGLPSLTTLYLSSTNISDDGLDSIAKLKSLERLQLNQTKITDRGLLKLSGHDRIREVEIRDTLVTPDGVEKLRQAKPKLKIIQ